jgi:hypothetical protein
MKVEEEEKEKEEEEDESDLIFCEKPYFSDRVSYLKGFHPWREGATHCDLCSQLYIYAESKQHGPPYCFIGMNSKQRQHIHQTCAAFFPKLVHESNGEGDARSLIISWPAESSSSKMNQSQVPLVVEQRKTLTITEELAFDTEIQDSLQNLYEMYDYDYNKLVIDIDNYRKRKRSQETAAAAGAENESGGMLSCNVRGKKRTFISANLLNSQ